MRARRSRALPLLLLLLALAVLFAILEWDMTRGGRGVRSEDAPAPVGQLDAQTPALPAQRQPPPRVASAPPRPPAAAPTPEDIESRCGGVGAYGQCEGNIAKACVGNAIYTVDCAARGGRCVMTSEGAQCLAVGDPSACVGTEPARCAGDHLQRCEDGTWQEIDCAKRGGRCGSTARGEGCLTQAERPEKHPASVVEICDGRDNDLDGRIDEMDVCAAVPLVAFLPKGYDPPNLDRRMQQELAILNGVYAPTVFRWLKSASASEDYRRFDPKLLARAARELARSELSSFYIPVLYVEDLAMDPPKGGISTMPNNRCGRIRISDRPAPVDGLIVLGEGRQPETLAHEMGHYLGLCHTHQQLAPLALADAREPECERSGDGICDTAPDPGPTRCLRSEFCEIVCPNDDAQPDPTNIMSYYLGCRRTLTAEQLEEAVRNLTLRRGWFGCLDPTACVCTAGTDACPEEMSCQPNVTIDAPWTCQLDGPALPGSTCRDTSECGGGSFCLQVSTGERIATRCARPCLASDACDCIELGLPFRLCREDLPGELGARAR